MIEETFKLRKQYRIKHAYNELKPNRKEQVLMMWSLNKITNLSGGKLIEHILNHTIPMVGEYRDKEYNVRTHQRWTKRKVLRQLETKCLELKEI